MTGNGADRAAAGRNPAGRTPAERTLPASWYRDQALHERERAGVFAKTWLLLGHESRLKNPGDYLAETVAGFPLLLLRGQDGELRAFHNVCRHRAGPLVEDESGHCGQELVCRYHGWRYALDGRLKSARDFGPATDFDTREFALYPLHIATWRGFVFVAHSAAAGSLSALFEPLTRRTAHLPFESYVFTRRAAHDLSCNWKTYVENYLEGYHVPVVHPGLAREIDAARYRVIVEDRVWIHEAPPADAKKANGVFEGLWGFVWPNLAINIYRNGVMMERVVPLGAHKTRLVYDYYFDPKAAKDSTLAMSNEVTAEDIRIVEAVQRNLDAGIYEWGRLSPRHENGVAAFQKSIREAIA